MWQVVSDIMASKLLRRGTGRPADQRIVDRFDQFYNECAHTAPPRSAQVCPASACLHCKRVRLG